MEVSARLDSIGEHAESMVPQGGMEAATGR
jgi:hypothetical protein